MQESTLTFSSHALERIHERIVPILRGTPGWDRHGDEQAQYVDWVADTLNRCRWVPSANVKGRYLVWRRCPAMVPGHLTLVVAEDGSGWTLVTVLPPREDRREHPTHEEKRTAARRRERDSHFDRRRSGRPR